MRAFLHVLPLIASLTVVASDPTIHLFGNRSTMQKRVEATVKSYANELILILDGLRSAQASSKGEQRTIIDASVNSIEAIMEDPNAASVGSLMPLVNLLKTHNTDDNPRILPSIDNASVQSTLNYLIEGIFNARMMGAADTTTEQELEEMLQFYAKNLGQTSETSWMGNDEMLFVFGDRVINTLVTRFPDRIDAFYKAVQDARKNPGNRSGPAEQLRNYEAAFARLEMLATNEVLPKTDPTTSHKQPSASSQIPTHAQPTAPGKPTEQKSAPSTAVEEPSRSKSWPVVAAVVVAVLGLMWVWLNKRK